MHVLFAFAPTNDHISSTVIVSFPLFFEKLPPAEEFDSTSGGDTFAASAHTPGDASNPC